MTAGRRIMDSARARCLGHISLFNVGWHGREVSGYDNDGGDGGRLDGQVRCHGESTIEAQCEGQAGEAASEGERGEAASDEAECGQAGGCESESGKLAR